MAYTDKKNNQSITYLIQCRDSRRKASMDTKYFVFDKRRQTEKNTDMSSDLIFII